MSRYFNVFFTCLCVFLFTAEGQAGKRNKGREHKTELNLLKDTEVRQAAQGKLNKVISNRVSDAIRAGEFLAKPVQGAGSVLAGNLSLMVKNNFSNKVTAVTRLPVEALNHITNSLSYVWSLKGKMSPQQLMFILKEKLLEKFSPRQLEEFKTCRT